jgi:hypothetical protein
MIYSPESNGFRLVPHTAGMSHHFQIIHFDESFKLSSICIEASWHLVFKAYWCQVIALTPSSKLWVRQVFVLILGISQACLLVPLSVLYRGGLNFQVFWSSEPLFCYKIFLNETVCTFYDSKDQWTATANLFSVVRKEIVNIYMSCAWRIFCVSQKTNTKRGVKWKFRLA